MEDRNQTDSVEKWLFAVFTIVLQVKRSLGLEQVPILSNSWPRNGRHFTSFSPQWRYLQSGRLKLFWINAFSILSFRYVIYVYNEVPFTVTVYCWIFFRIMAELSGKLEWWIIPLWGRIIVWLLTNGRVSLRQYHFNHTVEQRMWTGKRRFSFQTCVDWVTINRAGSHLE